VDSQRYDLPVAAVLRLHARSGKIDVVAEPRDDVLVEGEHFDAEVTDGGASLEVRAGRAGSKPLLVRCPAGTDICVGTQSGSVRMSGDFGSVSVTTMSGNIDVGTTDEADLRTGSGSIALEGCRERCRLNTVSGKINAGAVAAVAAGTMSGSITIERVSGKLKARTVSGSISAHLDGEGNIAVKTVSGKVQLSLPEGTALATRFKTISGKVRNPFPAGDDLYLEAMTISGSIELVPA
jgi:DUF4097 and DUF4098 domain-containing protein YvlB